MASPSSAEAINRLLNSPNLSPREKVRLREQAIKAGVKGTSLHLGAPTPEVIAQLEKSRSQQKFSTKKQDLDTQIAEVKARGVVLGNSSTRPELTQQTAKQTFATQQAFTQAKSAQVRSALQSKEFQQIKQAGTRGGTTTTHAEVRKFLNTRGLAVPTFERQIVTELAQKDIQGKTQTEQNISRILDQAGFRNVAVSITPEGKLNTGMASQEVLAPIVDTINTAIGGVSDAVAGMTGEPSFTDILPIEPEQPTEQGSIIDTLRNFIFSPIGIALIGFVIMLAILGKPAPMAQKIKVRA